MDNISRRYSNEDTATSMYLSFDAESTTSTACYRTLEAMSDMSDLSAELGNPNGSNQMNKTLEGHTNSQNGISSETVKKNMEISVVKSNTSLKALPKNILREYKVLCSTPSKEQLLKTVDVTRGSDATKCVDLGLAFQGIDDGKPAYFSPNIGAHEENKENVFPDTEEVCSLSTCSSGETNSVIEKKLNSMSNVGSVIETEPVGMNNIETTTSNIEKKMCSMPSVGSTTEADPVDDIRKTENFNGPINPNGKLSENNAKCQYQNDEKICELLRTKMENVQITPKSNIVQYTEKSSFVNNDGCENQMEEENYNQIVIKIEHVDKVDNEKCTVEEKFETRKLATSDSRGLKIEENIKPPNALLNRKTRFSVCEPNLQTGKPSRISSSNSQRRSLLPTSTKTAKNTSVETEIAQLIPKMLKMAAGTEPNEKNINKSSESALPADKGRSIISKRTSLSTSAPGFKRPFNFKPRMSVLVKTTLNSPARKIARRSAVSGVTQSMPRKSISQTISSANNSKLQKVEYPLRKSMVAKPTDFKVNTMANANTLVSLQGASTSSQRKSLYPVSKTLDKETFSQRKPDISYICGVCKEKFRVKSLLDAHKRSHETDSTPPAFIKKPTTMKQSLSCATLGNQNQCKYCDKKFALTKALHIHLLQNCLKIPPLEKRKLEYTDLNHVEKAQLPDVFPNHTLQSNSATSVSKARERFRYAANKIINNDTRSSSESLNDKKDKLTSFKSDATANANNPTAFQNTGHKVKKISAHAGVYRTPSKTVPCHICKLTFKSILDYTNHNLTSHGNNKTSAVNDTGLEKRNSEHNI